MKEKKRFILLWICVSAVLLLGSLAVPGGGKTETIQETMRDAVLHESNQISLFGLRPVNPGFLSALVVTAVLLIAALTQIHNSIKRFFSFMTHPFFAFEFFSNGSRTDFTTVLNNIRTMRIQARPATTGERKRLRAVFLQKLFIKTNKL